MALIEIDGLPGFTVLKSLLDQPFGVCCFNKPEFGAAKTSGPCTGMIRRKNDWKFTTPNPMSLDVPH